MDAAVLRERLEPGVDSNAEVRKRVGFPTVGETMRLMQLDRVEGVGERGEHSTGGANGAELVMVADQHEFGAMAHHEVDDAVEILGWGECPPRR
jgi:hypothetical protein